MIQLPKDSEGNLIVRKAFSKSAPAIQLAWDSVSRGAAKKCFRYYQHSILEGWNKKGPGSLHLRYGILYHRALEVYDHKTFEGMPHEEALVFALRDLAEGCMDTIHVTEENLAAINHMAQRRNIPLFEVGDSIRTWWNPAEGLSEKKAQANTKTVPNLFRTVIWYLEQFGPNDPAKTVRLANGKPAVEVSFRYENGAESPVTGEDLMDCGHLDRVVEFNDDLWVLDRKTTQSTIDFGSASQYFAQYSPNNQMTGYAVAGGVVMGAATRGVIIDAAQIAKGFSRFVRGFTTRTEESMSEWLESSIELVEDVHVKVEHALETGRDLPMNDTACDMYGGCTFRDICSKSPSVRNAYLKTAFSQERAWDPLETRGDI